MKKRPKSFIKKQVPNIDSLQSHFFSNGPCLRGYVVQANVTHMARRFSMSLSTALPSHWPAGIKPINLRNVLGILEVVWLVVPSVGRHVPSHTRCMRRVPPANSNFSPVKQFSEE